MGKVSIKKNIKPKKTITKKTVKPKKTITKKEVQKEKEQTQSQNVIVNINDTITKKKRGRPTKKSTIEKKPVSQAIAPVIQSYNQPIFNKQAPQQPSSLASSILASQNVPKVIKEEAKEESALKKALIDQNISTEEPENKANDLERVRVERIKKFSKPVEDVKEEPIRHALLGQLLSDQGDDTEEINQLKFNQPEKQDAETQTFSFERKFRVSLEPPEDFESLKEAQRARSKRAEVLRQRKTITESSIPFETDTEFQATTQTEPTETIEQTDETPLTQPEERGAIDLTTTSDISEPTPLTLQPTLELGFGGLTEEPVQTSVGQFLPPEPVSQEQLLRKQQQLPPLSILSPIPYRTERLVKDDEGPTEPPPPIARAESIQQASIDESTTTQEAKPLKPSDYVKEKWRELKSQGHFDGVSMTFTNPKTGKSQDRPSAVLEAEIQTIEPSYKKPPKRTPGAKIQSTNVVEAT